MAAMRALIVREWGATPSVAEFPEPSEVPGRALVRVRAAGLNPVDAAIASGDALWGDSAAAAIAALRRGGRVVQVGSAESPVLEVVGGPRRGRRVALLGFSVLVEDPRDLRRAYAELAGGRPRRGDDGCRGGSDGGGARRMGPSARGHRWP